VDIEKIVTFVSEYASTYFHAFVNTLRHPSVQFQPTRTSSLVLGSDSRSSRVSPELFTFAVLSIIVGLLLRSISPLAQQAGLLPEAIMVLVFWSIFAAVLHGALRSVGGRAIFVDTATITLQVFGVIYVICNAAALIARTLAQIPSFARFLSGKTAEIVIYYPLQLTLLCVYLPIALRGPHGLTRSRLFVAVTLWALGFATLSAVFLYFADRPMAPPPAGIH
jgi:hypothetical protein